MLRPVGKLCYIALVAGCSVALAQQYTITTAAGGAPPTTPVAAASTSIGQPARVATDSSGNVYFTSLNSVFKISGGNLTLVAGNARAGFSGDNGPATRAQLNSPQGLALDNAGNLYIADSKNNRIRIVNKAGVINTFAGTGQVSAGGPGTYNDGGLATNALLRLPGGVAVDSNGVVYIADTGDNLIRKVTTDGIITSIVGDSLGSYKGDANLAVNAEVHTPQDVAVDSNGNVYIADTANSLVRKVTSDGQINYIAGTVNATTHTPTTGFTGSGDGGVATSAIFVSPYALSLDSSGNLYIVDNGDHRVRKVDSKGNINSVAGTGTGGFAGDSGAGTSAQLNFPSGVAADSSGNVYIADSLNRRVRKLAGTTISTAAGNGNLSYSGDGGVPTNAQLNAPQAVAAVSPQTAGAGDTVYIADTANNVLRRVVNLVISGTGAPTISTFAGNGTAGFGGDSGAATSAQLNAPQGVAVDSTGNTVYVSDTQNARVRKIVGGTITTVAGNGTPGFGGDNGAATSAQLNLPTGLAVDGTGNLYIADFSNNRIRKVTPGGTISTFAGNGLAGYSGDGGQAASAMLTTPMGVAVDSAGNVYIADTGNNAVRVVNSAGVISTYAGNGLPGYSGDGGLAKAAQVGNPVGVAVDSSGNVYVTDGSVRVRKVFATGFIITIAGNGTRGYAGDGGSAPFAMLNGATGLAADSNANVFVADAGNNAVRLVIPGGFNAKITSIVNAASGLAGPISGGEIVAIYGSALGPATLSSQSPNGQVSTALAGTTVHFGNYAAPLLYTSAGQVGAIVPYEVTTSGLAFVTYNGDVSAAIPFSVAQATPAIFTADYSGKGLAAAINIHNGGYSYNSPASPATAGDYVELFLTGTGQTNPPSVDGQPTPDANEMVALPVLVTIGGKSVTPQYAGGVPGTVAGMTQINIQIPSGLTPGLVAITVQIGSVSAPTGVAIAVK
jgi:uncharacterized protein (TIGR03437 family)